MLPVRPTFTPIFSQLRDRGRGSELEGDRPARLAPDHAERLLHLVVVDLHDHAVDLVVELLAALLPAVALDLEELNDPELARRRSRTRGCSRFPASAPTLRRTSCSRRSAATRDSCSTRGHGRRTAGSPARRGAKDATIERRFRRYGEYAGLAFWLYLTRAGSRTVCRSSRPRRPPISSAPACRRSPTGTNCPR